MKNIVLTIVLLNHLLLTSAQSVADDPCVFRETGDSGICKLIYNCPSAIEDVRNFKHPQLCGFEGRATIVCCRNTLTDYSINEITSTDVNVEQSETKLRISDKKCLEYSEYVYENITINTLTNHQEVTIKRDRCAVGAISLIIGGSLAAPREFPHMALLGYDLESIKWLCGGSLISDRFVLTAAHCLKSRAYGPVVMVRLGDLNYDTDEDEARPTDIRIKRTIGHPLYTTNSFYNDLALLELEDTVRFNPFVRPACIPSSYEISSKRAIVTGWGKVSWTGNKSSASLLKVTLDLFSHANCNKSFEFNINRRLREGIVDATQLCAGSYDSEKDSCEGDSGGPMQVLRNETYCMYNIIGITSFGKACGNVGVPGVYTRISHYIDWIESVVWPQNL